MPAVKVPPIKSQGIKTKLIPWLDAHAPKVIEGAWIEPFMGTGAVAFNLARSRASIARLADNNPHVVAFYADLVAGRITPPGLRQFLEVEGALLNQRGADHYYAVRQRFNKHGSPLDFLFLNRSCFNGMMRFNKSGGFNTPFCKRDNRFAPAMITKIVNQASMVLKSLEGMRVTFKCQDFRTTVMEAGPCDMVYADPPYAGRSADYFQGWGEQDEKDLSAALTDLDQRKGRFMVSTWHHTAYRQNDNLAKFWSPFKIQTVAHTYHLGGKVENRQPVTEALIMNF